MTIKSELAEFGPSVNEIIADTGDFAMTEFAHGMMVVGGWLMAEYRDWLKPLPPQEPQDGFWTSIQYSVMFLLMMPLFILAGTSLKILRNELRLLKREEMGD